ncbi:Uma2 family endonuclease [Acaryochloris sp. CCMEE 5410]|uniref:Uma2 family endonuclease n=1 Tax=Acaryochloris sp. CCMEE 5410 TaxID=310037 RepID=UPI0002484808|nr:Uma2 family endonuclease [Acaryochloris sp. CCMEE 5410]KAI9131088.1 Uma2 family endonuclease [Acaryochloris sp. CCMEE 5410]
MLSEPLILNVETVHLSDEQFYQFCIANRDLRVERTKAGRLVLMPPVGGESGNRELEFGIDLGIWNRQTQLGKVFSSSTIFKLPGGGDRSPDAAWVQQDRWHALTLEQQQKFPPIAPDFVFELRSRSDAIAPLREKMEEYLACGVQLGWLFNPQEQQVEIYRQGHSAEVRSLPTTLSGEDILPGFQLSVERFAD